MTVVAASIAKVHSVVVERGASRLMIQVLQHQVGGNAEAEQAKKYQRGLVGE